MSAPPPEISSPHRILPAPSAFNILAAVPRLFHGVFDRHGGVSLAPYASLNASWTIGDQESAVRQNLERIKSALGVAELVAAPQVHGDTVLVIDEETLPPLDPHLPVRLTLEADALVTRLDGIGLMIKVADCQAVFLVDPVRQVVANVHCGWRGSVQGILGKVVRLLHERFQSRPADLLAAVSPSLGPCCAEFRNYPQELPEAFLPSRSAPTTSAFGPSAAGSCGMPACSRSISRLPANVPSVERTASFPTGRKRSPAAWRPWWGGRAVNSEQ